MTNLLPQAPFFKYGVRQPLVAAHIVLTKNACYALRMMIQKYKSNNNIVYSCKYHIVWCTKYRKALLRHTVEQHLKVILHQIAKECQSLIIELEIMPDHVHILIGVDPQYGVTKLIKSMKGRSSRTLRALFPELQRLPALWTNSCFISTVDGAPLQIIKQYIQNQKNV